MAKPTPAVVLFVAILVAGVVCVALGDVADAGYLFAIAGALAWKSPFTKKDDPLNPTPSIERVDGEQ
jgi:drug/metabolite transporter (DMT)-like permease